MRLQYTFGGEGDKPGIVTGNGVISYHSILCYEIDNQELGYQMLKKQGGKVRNVTQDLQKDKEISLMALT